MSPETNTFVLLPVNKLKQLKKTTTDAYTVGLIDAAIATKTPRYRAGRLRDTQMTKLADVLSSIKKKYEGTEVGSQEDILFRKDVEELIGVVSAFDLKVEPPTRKKAAAEPSGTPSTEGTPTPAAATA